MLDLLAVPTGLEPVTFGLGNRCSIRLSYGTIALIVVDSLAASVPSLKSHRAGVKAVSPRVGPYTWGIDEGLVMPGKMGASVNGWARLLR